MYSSTDIQSPSVRKYQLLYKALNRPHPIGFINTVYSAKKTHLYNILLNIKILSFFFINNFVYTRNIKFTLY